MSDNLLSKGEIWFIKSPKVNVFDVYSADGTYFSSAEAPSIRIEISAQNEEEARSALLVKLMSGEIVIKPFTLM